MISNPQPHNAAMKAAQHVSLQPGLDGGLLTGHAAALKTSAPTSTGTFFITIAQNATVEQQRVPRSRPNRHRFPSSKRLEMVFANENLKVAQVALKAAGRTPGQ